jgi:hypothetical protein
MAEEDMDNFANGRRKIVSPSTSSIATENTTLSPSTSNTQTYFDQKIGVPEAGTVSQNITSNCVKN